MLQALEQSSINDICRLADKINLGLSEDRHLDAHIRGLPMEQLAELLALMWQGRDDCVDGRISFAEQLQYATDELDSNTVGYITGKRLNLSAYLRNGLRLINAELDGKLNEAPHINVLQS